MNIIEAVKSGKKIKRKVYARELPFYDAANAYTLRLTKEDILADDWEVQEEKIEITKTEFFKILYEFNNKAYGIKAQLDDWQNPQKAEDALWNALKDANKCG